MVLGEGRGLGTLSLASPLALRRRPAIRRGGLSFNITMKPGGLFQDSLPRQKRDGRTDKAGKLSVTCRKTTSARGGAGGVVGRLRPAWAHPVGPAGSLALLCPGG